MGSFCISLKRKREGEEKRRERLASAGYKQIGLWEWPEYLMH